MTAMAAMMPCGQRRSSSELSPGLLQACSKPRPPAARSPAALLTAPAAAVAPPGCVAGAGDVVLRLANARRV